MDKKWSVLDIVILIIEILAPIISVIITSVIPQGKLLSADTKLVIIGSGIVIPIILLQYSVTLGQNKNEKDVEELVDTMSDVMDKINHVSPILEQVFLSQNDRVKRFVYRRLGEVNKTIQLALNTNNSGNLKPNEYYEELLYLADLIIKDKDEQKKKFTGEVWAMTSFAEDEWIEDVGYEKLWTEKLKDIVDRGIKTRRLCIIPDNVYRIISSKKFLEPETDSGSEKSFQGLLSLLDDYYNRTTPRKSIAEHFLIRSNDNKELFEIKGFFAIKLTSGELHILHGETVNESGAMTAKVLFDPNEIRRVRQLFDRFTSSQIYEIGQKIQTISNNNGFMDYLKNRNIVF